MSDPVTAFIEAAIWHGSLEHAEASLAAHPELANSKIHKAAILGERRRFSIRLRGSRRAASTIRKVR
jgi:hypothetical protein